MIQLYVKLVLAGSRTIDQVHPKYRDEVENILAKFNVGE